mmetsp:Transcript_11660/g.46941  ORF Transcript_11660/g.46941 Transcript_11660/m.46941 type:complete len:303 (+) Transcript_11660:2-910(+)
MAANAAAGKCLGAHAALASRASISRRARLAPSRVPARQTRKRAATRAGPEDQLGTGNGDDLNYNVLAERMKALQAKESSDTNEAVDAAIEREQAIVAGIRGDAADRPMPGDFDALIEHLLSTPMEAMDYETVRCGPLMTKAFVEHIRESQKKLAARGPSGEESLVELQALEEWVMVARERQSEREDNARRAAAVEANGGEAPPVAVPIDANSDKSADSANSDSRFSVGEKFEILMSCAANGVDALRNAIIELARSNEIDDVLVSMLQSNALNAEEAGDAGRAKFLRKVAEVCVRERKAAGFD